MYKRQVLIRGEKGTAKSTAVRALAELLPQRQQVVGCKFGCSLEEENEMCDDCIRRKKGGEAMEMVYAPMKVIDLPVSATEDRVAVSYTHLDVYKRQPEVKKMFAELWTKVKAQ